MLESVRVGQTADARRVEGAGEAAVTPGLKVETALEGGKRRADATGKPPRLLVVGPLPPPYAGPEIGTRTLLHSPLRERYRIDHLDTTTRGTNAEKGTLRPSLAVAFLRFCAGLIRLLFRRPDCVLYLVTSTTFTGRVRDATFVVLAKLVFRRRVVMQFRGGHFRSAFEAAPRIARRVLTALLGRVDLMLVQAERLRGQFTGIIGPERVRVLPNAVDVGAFAAVERSSQVERSKRTRTPSSRPEPRASLDTEDPRGLSVLFIGHLSPAKGYCDLLRAASGVVERCPDVHFRIVGTAVKSERNITVDQVTGRPVPWEDPEATFRTEIAERDLAGRFEFLGNRVDGEEKLRVLCEADVFVLPSYSEGFSMALLEAIAAGTAVITTPVGAAPEVVRDGWNGYLVAPGDVRALEDRLGDLLVDEALRRRMAERNKRLARERYDVSSHVERLESMLRDLGVD